MRKLCLFAAGFAAAAAGYVYLRRDGLFLTLAAAALLCSILLRGRGPGRASVLLLGAALGIAWCFCYQITILGPANRAVGRTMVCAARVTDLPERTPYGWKAAVQVELEGRSFGAVLYGDETLEGAAPGDTVTGRCAVERTGMDILAGERLYLRAAGTFLTLYAEEALTVTPGQPNWYESVGLWLRNRIHTLFSGETAAFLQGLITGDQGELSYQTDNALAVTGLSHAVAVSGMHVSILLTMLHFLFRGSPRPTAWVGIPLTVAFTLVTGAVPSACRAAVMQILMLCAPLLRREYDIPTALGAGVLLLLLQNPWAIASVGLQLSFAAVAGLYLFSGPIQRRLLQWKLPRFAASGLSATVAATALTMPLSLLYFRTLSLVAPLSNLLCLGAVTWCFVLGILAAVAGPLGELAAVPARWITNYVLGVVRLLARFPYAAAYSQNPAMLAWGTAALLIAVGLLFLGWKRRRLWSGILLTGFLAAVLLGRFSLTAGTMTLQVLDVGQGQSLLLESRGFTAVLDCGGSYPEEAGEEMARTLLSAGLTTVDALVLTHFDDDHAGGAVQLLHRVRVDRVYLPSLPDAQGLAALVADTAEARGAAVLWVDRETAVTFPGGRLRLFPPEGTGRNDGLAILATAAEYDMLITGDLPTAREQALLRRYQLPRVELLVAGHHGAAGSTSQTLLGWVQPETVVISVGADNPYGHPAPETLQRIEQSGAALYRTDQMGTIRFRR